MTIKSEVLVSYDLHGVYELPPELSAVCEVSAIDMDHVGGGFFDGGCDGNAVCHNIFNKVCVNTLCMCTGVDNVCVINGVCGF